MGEPADTVEAYFDKLLLNVHNGDLSTSPGYGNSMVDNGPVFSAGPNDLHRPFKQPFEADPLRFAGTRRTR